MKFLIPLKNLVRNQIETHLLAFEIYFRKGQTDADSLVFHHVSHTLFSSLKPGFSSPFQRSTS